MLTGQARFLPACPEWHVYPPLTALTFVPVCRKTYERSSPHVAQVGMCYPYSITCRMCNLPWPACVTCVSVSCVGHHAGVGAADKAKGSESQPAGATAASADNKPSPKVRLFLMVPGCHLGGAHDCKAAAWSTMLGTIF